ncbi:MAG: hypothetical protein ACKVLK_17135, partial [Spongiibacter sp.]
MLFWVTLCLSGWSVAQPNLNHQALLLDPNNLNYNPTGEIIFPSLIKVSDNASNTLGNYYLYYAPHDAPGGI